MGSDDDIAESLPRPPRPAPARRQAAIEEALRRFDSGGGTAPALSGSPTAAPGAPWWTPFRRPYAGALVSAALVALIALPLAWLSFGERFPDSGGERRPRVVAEAPRRAPALAASEAAPRPAAAPDARARPGPAPAVEAPVAADATGEPAPVQLAARSPLAAKAAQGGAEPAKREEPAAARAAPDGSTIMVTGSRIGRPNLASASPVTAIGADEFARASAGRGDWNACTVDDPDRSLSGCGALVDPASKGSAGRSSAQLADGLTLAWKGDLDGAVEAFDRAVALSPRSAFAYLNRGLAYRRLGKLDRALADLDRAVRYAPRSARSHYNRSLVLRQRGDIRRARADEERAVELDPRYAAAPR